MGSVCSHNIVPPGGGQPAWVSAGGSLTPVRPPPSIEAVEVGGVPGVAAKGGVTWKPLPKTTAEKGGLPVEAKREMDYARARIKDMTPDQYSGKELSPADLALLDSYQTLLAELETKYGMRAPATPTPTAAKGSNVVGRVTRGPDGKPIFNWLK